MDINNYISELLHLNDISSNKLIDLDANSQTIYLSSVEEESFDFSSAVISIIKEKIGHPATVQLKDSQISGEGLFLASNKNIFNWCFGNGKKDQWQLHRYITKIYTELKDKGNNPLFLSVGALNWVLYNGIEDVKVKTPLLIYPIKLVRNGDTSPISIEFVDDYVLLNPCLIELLKRSINDKTDFEKFPHPNKSNIYQDIDLEMLKDGYQYLNEVKSYISSLSNSASFTFDKDVVAISEYNHNEFCLYNDVRRNILKINSNENVNCVFGESKKTFNTSSSEPLFTQKYDTIQEDIIKKVVAGNSLVIKGPPGSGKTLTISNMIASLIASGKTVLLSSEKIAALTEVYNKMPADLQKFVLLLESDTEAQAAKINSSEIRTDLNDIINYKKNYQADIKLNKDYQSLVAEYNKQKAIIDNHYSLMFKNEVLDTNFYDLIDKFYCQENYPLIDFIKDDQNISRQLFNSLAEKMKSVEKIYDSLVLNGKLDFAHTPYYGYDYKLDIEKENFVIENINKQRKIINEIYNEELINKVNEIIDIDKLDINLLSYLIDSQINNDLIRNIYDSKDNKNLKDEINKLEALLILTEINQYDTKVKYDEKEDYQQYLDNIISSGINLDLTKEDVDLVMNNYSLFTNDSYHFINDNDISVITNSLPKLDELHNDGQEHLKLAERIYKADLSIEDKVELHKILASSFDKAQKYNVENKSKIGAFDFGFKSIIKKLDKFAFNPEYLTVDDKINSIMEYHKYELNNDEYSYVKNQIDKVFRKQITDDDIKLLALISAKTNFKNVKGYVDSIRAANGTINYLANIFGLSDYVVNEILFKLNSIINYKNIYYLTSNLSLNDSYKINDLYKEAKAIVLIYRLAGNLENSLALIDTYKSLKNIFDDYKDNINLLFKNNYEITDYFAGNYMINKFAQNNLKSIYNYYNLAANLDYLGNYKRYLTYKETDAINKYMAPYEKSELNYKYNDTLIIYPAFIHSCYSQFIKDYITKNNLGVDSRTDVLNEAYYKFGLYENQILNLNIKLIEEKLLNNINISDSDYKFLMQTKDNASVRLLFKHYSKAILKLKRCIIASPSAISLLFRNSDYNEFDVAIIDEASQLKPVRAIPVMFRSRQLVIVGDEWQMPPIVHFERKDNYTKDNLDDLTDNSSLLSLALSKGCFETSAFEAHYRSKTEALIGYSQKKFYPYMRTFPSLKIKDDGLGFEDVYVANATSDGGINEKEAIKTIELLNEHFNKYFIDNTLLKSVGVVAFGIKQIEYITKLVTKDKELNKKINTAYKNFDGAKEKLVFFKTIEEVQGVETDHLILSLTYGVNKDGSVASRFGQLNQKEGLCIFNVSVTRAKYQISVIHSIKWTDIDNPNIEYIKEYLKYVEEFANPVNSYKSIDLNPGFVKSIERFIIKECNISSERVKYNYGVTDNSVRIPIAILNEDLKSVYCGIWIEGFYPEKNNIDYNVRYYNILENDCNWGQMLRIYSIDWYRNNEAVKKSLQKFILKENN